MSETPVLKLSEHSDSSDHILPPELLADVLTKIEAGEVQADAAFILLSGPGDSTFFASRLSNAEVVYLLEAAKLAFLSNG